MSLILSLVHNFASWDTAHNNLRTEKPVWTTLLGSLSSNKWNKTRKLISERGDDDKNTSKIDCKIYLPDISVPKTKLSLLSFNCYFVIISSLCRKDQFPRRLYFLFSICTDPALLTGFALSIRLSNRLIERRKSFSLCYKRSYNDENCSTEPFCWREHKFQNHRPRRTIDFY